MWSWKLWNLRLVSILPEPRALLTVMTALVTIQLAGDLSRVFTHSTRFLPSNRTMASEGGGIDSAGRHDFGHGLPDFRVLRSAPALGAALTGRLLLRKNGSR